jgi:hypothetical protein
MSVPPAPALVLSKVLPVEYKRVHTFRKPKQNSIVAQMQTSLAWRRARNSDKTVGFDVICEDEVQYDLSILQIPQQDTDDLKEGRKYIW